MTVALKSICIYAEARCLHRHVYVKFIVSSSTRSIVICKVVELGEKVFRVSPPSDRLINQCGVLVDFLENEIVGFDENLTVAL